MISVDEARTRILAGLHPVSTETVGLDVAWNRVLGRPVEARLDQPPADMSAMDGYALRAADARPGASLPVIGSAPAGSPFAGSLAAGTALRLFTGSVIPDGADCVVIQEDVDRTGDTIRINAAGIVGHHIRPRGQDFLTGDKVLASGRRLTARDIGLAAAANNPWLIVYRMPRIALLATGDEIALPGEPLRDGGIVSSNSLALAAMIRAAGATPILLPLVSDDAGAIAAVADQLGGCDLLVTTGGASVGDHDLIQSALGGRGLEVDFWKIAMRPGKPLIHGHLRNSGARALPMLGLPGNPVSAIVCATLFLRPAIAVLAGETPMAPATVQARLGADLPRNDARADFLRGRLSRDLDGALLATPFASQASSLLGILAQADALILRPPHAPAAAARSTVDVIRLAELGV